MRSVSDTSKCTKFQVDAQPAEHREVGPGVDTSGCQLLVWRSSQPGDWEAPRLRLQLITNFSYSKEYTEYEPSCLSALEGSTLNRLLCRCNTTPQRGGAMHLTQARQWRGRSPAVGALLHNGTHNQGIGIGDRIQPSAASEPAHPLSCDGQFNRVLQLVCGQLVRLSEVIAK